MRNFHVPFDMNQDEKIIGGYLTLKQGILAVIFAALAISSLINSIGGNLAYMVRGKVSGGIVLTKVIFFFLFIILGLIFMFRKPNDMMYYKHLYVKFKYNRKKKKIYYEK